MAQIHYETNHMIGCLVIDNPGRRNALTFAMQETFAYSVQIISEHPPAVLIIRGNGQEAFAAGGDLKELLNQQSKTAARRLSTVMRVALDQLTQLPCPVIGVANGDAVGGGVEILSACDIRIAAGHARLHFAQVRNGLITGWGGTARLIHLLGASRAADLLLKGRTITAHEAQLNGFIHQVIEHGEPFENAVLETAQELMSLPRLALAQQKRLLWLPYHQLATNFHEAEQQAFVSLFGETDHSEALIAFQEKRPPSFNIQNQPDEKPRPLQ